MKAVHTLLAATALLALPAIAQVNLSGVWGMTLYEDFPDRLPGPELGDYGGIPLNAAARMRAESWDASLITLPEYQCRVHPSDYASSFADIRIWEEIDPATQQLVAIHTHHFAWETERTICHGQVGRRQTLGYYHAPERRLDPPQWSAAQRPRRSHRILHPPWRRADLGRAYSRSNVSDRNLHSLARLCVRHGRTDPAVPVRERS